MGRQSAKSELFLMELIIAVGFFAVAGAICMQLFAKSHAISRRSDNISMALTVAQSAAEGFKAKPCRTEEAAALANTTEEHFYDATWQTVGPGSTWVYRMVLAYSARGTLLEMDVAVYALGIDGEELLQDIAVRQYIPA